MKNLIQQINKDCGLPNDIAIAIQKKKQIAYKAGMKKVFNKFDDYACIKNDNWYLDFKKECLK